MRRILLICGLLILFPSLSLASGQDIWVVSTGSEGNFETLLGDDYNVTVKTTTELKEEGIPSSVELLIYPGGLLPIAQAQDEGLQTAIRDYVSSGGSFFGSCGGSIPGAVDMTWNYGVMNMVGLVQLNAYDYLSWGSAGYSGNFVFNENELNGDYVNQTKWLTYSGGPAFEIIEGNEDEIEVLASYEGDIYDSDSVDTTGMAAIVLANYGQGRVILSAPHPESVESTRFLFFNYIDYLLELNTPNNLVNTEKGVYKAILGWDEVNQAEGYEIKYKKSSANGYITTFSESNSIELNDLMHGGKYHWSVRAMNGENYSEWSGEHRLITYPRKVKKAEFIFPQEDRDSDRLRIKIETMKKRITGFNVLVYKNNKKIKTVKIKNNASKKFVYAYVNILGEGEYKFQVKARREIGETKFLSQKVNNKFININN